MKKARSFFALIPVLFVLACTLPNSIEIKATPKFTIFSNLKIGSLLSDVLEDSFKGSNELSIIRCINTTYYTLMLHINLFDETFDIINLPDGSQFLPPNLNIPVPAGGLDLINPGSSMTLPLQDLGDLLNGFEFDQNEVITKLYFSGSSILSKLAIELTVGTKPPLMFGVGQAIQIDNKESDRAAWVNNEYTGTTAPGGGVEVGFPLCGDDVDINFRVFIPAGQVLTNADFNNAYIKVELVVWLPFIFRASSTGASLGLPDGFFGEDGEDIFGRNPGDEGITDFIESLTLVIGLDKNPFDGADLTIRSTAGNFEIKNRLSNNSLSFSISEQDMQKINSSAYFPFSPQLSLDFEPNKLLKLPRNFNITSISFEARISYAIEL